jgi:hypothetical protein
MKKLIFVTLALLLASLLSTSSQAYFTPNITKLTGDINPYGRLELADGYLKTTDNKGDITGPGLLTLTNMIGDNDGYGYGHEIVGDGDDLPYTDSYGWLFDNRSDAEKAAVNGAQATDIRDNFDVTFMHRFDFSQFDYLTEAYFTIDISGLQQNVFGGVSRLFLDGMEVVEFLTIDQGVWGSSLLTYAVDLSLLSDGALDVYFDNWFNDFASDHVGIDFTRLTVTGFTGQPIPEPTTMLLTALGLAGIGVRFRFRR